MMNLLEEILTVVRDAYLFAAKVHRGQRRPYSNIEYIKYLEFMACIIGRVTEDPELIAATLLHKVLENKKISIEDLVSTFNDYIAQLAYETSYCDEERRGLGRKEYILAKFYDMSVEAVTISLCIILCNLYEIIQINNTNTVYTDRYLGEVRYVLDNINFEFTEEQAQLVENILSAMWFIEVTKNV